MLTLFLLGIVFCYLMSRYVLDIFIWGCVMIGLGAAEWLQQNYNHFDNILDLFTKLR